MRLAKGTDVKERNAREASRFYLLHPEHDPAERRQNGRERGGRRIDRGEYRRPRFDDRENRRRQDGDTFDVSMYDDDAGNGSRRRDDGSRMRNGSQHIRRNSYSSRDMDTSGDDSGRKRVHFGPRRTDDYGRLRDRSASPGHDGDGRMGFEEDENSVRRRIRQRSQTPPSYRREQRNQAKELLTRKSAASAVLSSSSASNELFPNRSSPTRRTKEVFPHKTPTSNHRRSDAIDASAVEEGGKSRSLADRITPRSLADRITPRDLASRITPRNLADRITHQDESYGRLNNDSQDSESINIRGSAEQTAGFSIRGAATNDGTELFPDRQLFSTKIKGRGGPRRRAEDLNG